MRRGLEVRRRWPEFRRGKSAGKIHGSLCRGSLTNCVCLQNPLCRYIGMCPFSRPIPQPRRETRAQLVSEK